MNRIKTLEIHKPGVYAIHNKRNDKYYIGSTNDLCNRTTTQIQQQLLKLLTKEEYLIKILGFGEL